MNETAVADARALANWEAQMLRGPEEHVPDYEPETRDIDTLVDWISGECFNCEPQPKVDALCGITSHDLMHLSVPALVAIAFDFAQPRRARCAALDAIDALYIKGRA